MMTHPIDPLCCLAICLCALGCQAPEAAPTEPEGQVGWRARVRFPRPVKADVLFVIDNSGSMDEEHGRVADQVALMVRELVAPSRPHAPQIDDLRVGVITTDVGAGGMPVEGCPDPNVGDGGVLLRSGGGGGCSTFVNANDCPEGESCPWLSHSPASPADGSVPDVQPIWEEARCLASLGTGGCDFERPLEATVAALTANARAGGPNEGFIRDDSRVAVIIVTDEDDCSAASPDFYDPSREDLGDLGVRCVRNEDQLQPVSKYVEELLALFPDQADRLSVSVVAGVPIDGSWNPGDPLERLRLLRDDPDDVYQGIPTSCQTAVGSATAPARLAEFAYAFGNNGLLESICHGEWSTAIQPITRRIGFSMTPCIFWDLVVQDEACRLIETIADDGPCPNPVEAEGADGWHRDLGLAEMDGSDRLHRQCEIVTADADGDGAPDGEAGCSAEDLGRCVPGWFIDRSSGECEYGELRVTRPGRIGASTYQLECRNEYCAAHRYCPEAARSADDCSDGSCPEGAVCETFRDADVCGWEELGEDPWTIERPATCRRCVSTLGLECPRRLDWTLWPEDIVLGQGVCCPDGFRCDRAAGRCEPVRGTVCE